MLEHIHHVASLASQHVIITSLKTRQRLNLPFKV